MKLSSRRDRWHWRVATLGLVLLASWFSQRTASAQVKPTRRVLILNEVDPSHPSIGLFNQGIRASLKNSPYSLDFYYESMDIILFPDPAEQERIRDFLSRKYENRRPDVIMTVGSAPLRFMIEAHKRLFPGVP